MSSNFLDIVLRVLGSNASERAIKNTASELDGLGGSAKGAAGDLSRVGQNTSGIAAAEAKVRQLSGALDRAANDTKNLNDAFDGAKKWGAGLALAGAGGVLLSNKLAQMGNDVVETENLVKESFGANLQAVQAWSNGLHDSLGLNAVDVRRSAATFNVMFESMGLVPGEALNMSKSLTQLAYDMSSFYNLKPEEAFEKLKSGITGEAEPLKALGILVTEETTKQKAYQMGIAKTGEALTEQQKVQARYALILSATSKAQGDLERTMDSGANKARIYGENVKTTMQEIGSGSAAAQMHLQSLTGGLVTAVGVIPGLAPAGGYLLSIASYAASAGGSIIAFTAQLGQSYLALQAYNTAKSASAVATGIFATAEWDAAFAAIANTSAQNGAAVATTLAGNAAGTAAVKVGILATVQAAAMTTLGAASLGLIALVTGIGIAVAVVVGGIIYKLGQMLGLIDKNRSMMSDLKRGWDVITGNEKEAETSIMREQRAKVMSDIDTNAAAMRSDGKSESEIEAYKKRATLAAETEWAANFKKHGAQEDYVKSSEAIGAIRKQDEAMAAANVPVAPPPISLAVTPTSGLAVGTATGAAATAGTTSAGDSTAIQAQIDALNAQKKVTKDKAAKAAIDSQISGLKNQKKSADTATKNAKRKAMLGAKTDSSLIGSEMQGRMDEAKAVLDERKDVAKDDLDNQIDAIKQQIKMHQIGKDAGQSQIDKLNEAHDHKMEAWEQEGLAERKRMESQMILAQASAEASTKSADEASSIIQMAQGKSARALREAGRAEARAAREFRKSQDTGQTTTPGAMFTGFAKRTGSFVQRGSGMFDPTQGRKVYAAEPKYTTDAMGNVVVQFPALRIPQSKTDAALGAF